MKSILKLLLTAVAVIVLAQILPGITVNSFTTAVIVAFVLAILKFIVRPILVILTLPVTILTFGLFLFIINAFIILMADYFVSGFSVSGVLIAIVFSILLSIVQSILFSMISDDKND